MYVFNNLLKELNRMVENQGDLPNGMYYPYCGMPGSPYLTIFIKDKSIERIVVSNDFDNLNIVWEWRTQVDEYPLELEDFFKKYLNLSRGLATLNSAYECYFGLIREYVERRWREGDLSDNKIAHINLGRYTRQLISDYGNSTHHKCLVNIGSDTWHYNYTTKRYEITNINDFQADLTYLRLISEK